MSSNTSDTEQPRESRVIRAWDPAESTRTALWGDTLELETPPHARQEPTEEADMSGNKRGAIRGTVGVWAASLGIRRAGAGTSIRDAIASMRRTANRGPARRERFSEAVARLGLTDGDLELRELRYERDTIAHTIAGGAAAIVAAIILAHGYSWLLGGIAALVAAAEGARAISWAFRRAQVRDRELYSFADWLRRRKTGAWQ